MEGKEVQKVQQLHASAAPFVPAPGSVRIASALSTDKLQGKLQTRPESSPTTKSKPRKEPATSNVTVKGSANAPGNGVSSSTPKRSKQVSRKKNKGDYDLHEFRHGHHSYKELRSKANHHEWAPFSRERFVQANFTFCVNRDGNYSSNITMADVLVDWNLIEMVVVLADVKEDDQRCPICLDDYQAAKMTACGHTFCYLCMLRHLSYTDQDLSRCPLCADKISAADLKSVVFSNISRCGEDAYQRFSLLSRPRTSIIIEEVNEAREDPTGRIGTFNPQRTTFARFSFTNEEFYLRHLEKESDQVTRAVSEADDVMLMSVFGEMAHSVIRASRADLRRRLRKLKSVNMKPVTEIDAAGSKKGGIAENDRSTLVTGEGSEGNSEIKIIYQADTGETAYLHPLNIKCLAREYDSYRNFPLHLEAKVLEIERHVMNEYTRKKYRFLSHLPLGCEFALCELDLSSLLSKRTLEEFRGELANRKDARIRQKKHELKEEREAMRNRRIFEEYDELHRVLLSAPLPPKPETMDINDTSSFPTLSPGASSLLMQPGQGLSQSPTIAPQAVHVSPADSPAAVSSYASITRNMGFYPGLEGTSAVQNEEVQSWSDFPTIADSAWGRPTQGAWAPSSKTKKKKSKTIMST